MRTQRRLWPSCDGCGIPMRDGSSCCDKCMERRIADGADVRYCETRDCIHEVPEGITHCTRHQLPANQPAVTIAQAEQPCVGMPDPNITNRPIYRVPGPRGGADLVFERKLFVLAGDEGHRWYEWVPKAE